METQKNPHDTRAQFGGRYTPLIRQTFKDVSEDAPDMTVQQIVEHLSEFYQRNAAENINMSMEIQAQKKLIAELTEKSQSLENQLQELQAENANLSDAAQSSADNSDAELQKLQAQVEEYEEKIASITVNAAEREEQLEKQAADLRQMANTNALELQKMTLASANPEQGKYLVEFGDVAREIMDLTLFRLREKLQKPDLTASTLLTDLFVKYTKTRNHFGSFPTMVSGEEIKVIMNKYNN